MGKKFCWVLWDSRDVLGRPSCNINNIFCFVFVGLLIVVVTSGYEGRDFQNTCKFVFFNFLNYYLNLYFLNDC